MSGVRMARHYLSGMLKRNWGRIIFISSESGVQIPAEMAHYGVTKSAQIAVARGIAESVAGTGVTANSAGVQYHSHPSWSSPRRIHPARRQADFFVGGPNSIALPRDCGGSHFTGLENLVGI